MALFADAGPQGFGVGADRVDQFTPFGNVVFGDKNRRVATTTLSPEMQGLFDQQMLAQNLLGQQGIGMAGSLPGAGQAPIGGAPFNIANQPFNLDGFKAPTYGAGAQIGTANPFNLLNMMGNNTDFSAERDRVEKASFDRMMALMNPEFNRQEGAMQQRLANQGLPQASRAYASETGNFGDIRNRATESAALSAILTGGDEQSRLLNDLLATSQTGIGQAMGNRQQRFGEALQGYGANTNASLAERQQQTGERTQQRGIRTNEALANRQIPFNELMAIMGLNQVGMPQFQQQAGANTQGAVLGAQAAGAKNALFGDLIGGLIGAGGKIGAAAIPV